MIFEYNNEEIIYILTEIIKEKGILEGYKICEVHWKDYNSPSGIVFTIERIPKYQGGI